VIGVATNLEKELTQHLIRFKELDQHQSGFRPIDMALARFDRRRFSVIGRPSEATSDSKSLNSVEAFNMVYVQCDPGKGIGLHKHNTAEIFWDPKIIAEINDGGGHVSATEIPEGAFKSS